MTLPTVEIPNRYRLRLLADIDELPPSEDGEVRPAALPDILAIVEALGEDDRTEIAKTLQRLWCRDAQQAGDPIASLVAAATERNVAVARAEKAERERDDALAWSDDDRPIPEDGAISAAHPCNSGAHVAYQEAMRMVGAKRSKGALVDLVNWLLVRAETAEKKR